MLKKAMTIKKDLIIKVGTIFFSFLLKRNFLDDYPLDFNQEFILFLKVFEIKT